MDLRRVFEGDLEALAELAATQQVQPERHIVYIAVETSGIAAELRETTWQQASIAAYVDDRLVGWLIGDVDDELGRVFWIGPFVIVEPWEEIADALLASCRSQLAPNVHEEEMAIDVAFDRLEHWAVAAGFHAEAGAFVLTFDGEMDPPTRDVRSTTDHDVDAVVRLHDEMFPGTHTSGRKLLAQHDEIHPRLVIEVDGRVAGYVAVERQPDGSGYIDYLGVDTAHRRTGIGADLVRAGVRALRAVDANPIALTVREDSRGARELYESLGFTEERLARPLRRGFSLA